MKKIPDILRKDIKELSDMIVTNPRDFAQLLRFPKANYDLNNNLILSNHSNPNDLPLTYAVSRASGQGNEPVMVRIAPKTVNSVDIKHAVIGKGVLFDTGGSDTKGSSYGMHLDKSGAMAAFGAALANADQTDTVFILVFANNMTGPNALLPGEVIKSTMGNVEITNTDAEGRLLLADGIAYAASFYTELKSITTIATLTGSMSAALGKDYAGIFSTSNKFLARIMKDKPKNLWPMPFPKKDEIDSKRVDNALRNWHKSSKSAGHANAAQFLRRFLLPKTTIFNHIDMAGQMYDDSYKSLGFGPEELLYVLDAMRGK